MNSGPLALGTTTKENQLVMEEKQISLEEIIVQVLEIIDYQVSGTDIEMYLSVFSSSLYSYLYFYFR